MVRTAQDAPVNNERFTSQSSHYRIHQLPCEFLILVWQGKIVDIGFSIFVVFPIIQLSEAVMLGDDRHGMEWNCHRKGSLLHDPWCGSGTARPLSHCLPCALVHLCCWPLAPLFLWLPSLALPHVARALFL
jgi:hypothetical protein